MEIDRVQECFIDGDANSSIYEKIEDFILDPAKSMWKERDQNYNKMNGCGNCLCNEMSSKNSYGTFIASVPAYINRSIFSATLFFIGCPLKSCVLYFDEDAKKYNNEVKHNMHRNYLRNDSPMAVELNKKKQELWVINDQIKNNEYLVGVNQNEFIEYTQKTSDAVIFLEQSPKSISTETTKLMNNLQTYKTQRKDEMEGCQKNIRDLQAEKREIESQIAILTDHLKSLLD